MTVLIYLFGAFGLWLIADGFNRWVQTKDDIATRTEDLEWRIFRETMDRTR